MLEGPLIVLAHRIVVHPEFVGTLIPTKDPSAIHCIAMALGHRVQPLAATLVRLPVNLGLIKVKEEGWTGFSQGENPREIPRSSPASPRKPRPSRLFYLDLHSI